MGKPKNTLGLVAAAVAFGIVLGLIKGNDTGLRGGIGNLSAPWLLIGLVPALHYRTLVRGAAIGLICTLAGLVGFYATLTLVLHGQLGGGGPVPEFLVEMKANHIYLWSGAVSGPIAGAFGAWIGRRSTKSILLSIGALMSCEIAAVALAQGRHRLPVPFYFAWGTTDWAPYIGELLVGIAIIVGALYLNRVRPATIR
ncbi:MAG: hypothetical protein QOF16_1066 [Actinomycetota bacterium]|nr:hypothetical protein [Actinomycetota bacterium]